MSPRRLWLAIIIGPLAWLIYLQTAYMLVPWACRRPTGGLIALLAAGVLALALSTAGLATAWQAWRRVDRSGADTGSARARFMALTGIGTSALFVLIVVAGMLPLLLLAPCQ
jgi:hypothetical protein